MKKFKNTIILTTLLCTLPIIIGILLWNKLPSELIMTFGGEITNNAYKSKSFVVFGISGFLLLIHIANYIRIFLDPKKKNIGEKQIYFQLWAIPISSIIIMGLTYAVALGQKENLAIVGILIVVGAIFIIAGNYFPKTKKNYAVGYKTPWALDNEENWNKTHKLASKLYIIAGFIFIIVGMFYSKIKYIYIIFGVIILLVILPIIYSLFLYVKNKKHSCD